MKKFNTKKDNEKKGGLVGLLKGGVANTGSVTPGVIGGSAQASASGLATLFSAKVIGTVATVAIMGIAGIVGFSANSNMGGDVPNSQLMAASAQEAAEYVPAMQRLEAANEGKSSIAMFNEKNKGAVKFDIDPTLNNKNGKNAANGAEGSEYDENALGDYDNPEDYVDQAMAGAAEGAEGGMASINNSNLSTSFGGGDKSSKAFNMDKPKLKPTFKSMANMKPITNFKSNKALAYAKTRKANKVSASRAGARGGRGALGQARAMNAMLRSATGAKNYSTARATTDAAWVGTTGDGEATDTLDAAGLGEGEGMTVSSLGGGNLNGNSNSVYNPDTGAYIPDVSDSMDVTPWQKDLQTLQTMLMAALAMLAIAAILTDLSNTPWTKFLQAIAAAMIVAALAMSAYAVMLSMKLMKEYKQTKLGTIWLVLSGVTFAGCAIAAYKGSAAFFKASSGGLSAFATAIAGLKTWILAGSIVGGLGMSLLGSYGNKMADKEKAKDYCKSHPEHDGCYSSATTSALPYELSDSPVNRNILS